MTDKTTRRRTWRWALIAAVLFVVPLVAIAETVPQDLTKEIQSLNADVKQKRQQLDALTRKSDQYRLQVQAKRKESETLQDQVDLLDSRLARAELSIQIAEQEIKRLGLEIEVIDGKMRAQEEKAQEERVLIGALARRLYRQRAGRSTFEILVSHDSFSSFFDDIREIVKLETAVHKALGEVRSIQEALVHDRETRSQKQAAVTERQRDLEVIKVQLQDDHDFKTALLSQTQDSELDYRYRLAELKSQQNDADSEITYLEKVLRDKLALSDRIRSDGAVLSWPVSPGRGVSTRFHDPDYPFRYVFEHPGLDIRAAQGSPVRAAAAGVVARAKDAGFGYSYVLLIHNNSISTVYGHLSKIAVKEDTYVERGEIIGYSGGMPGTAGAGPLTTGPHLHFETRYGGIPVDPMKYLASF